MPFPFSSPSSILAATLLCTSLPLVAQEADLRVENSGPANAREGDAGTYVVGVVNQGPAATDARLTDTLPAGTTFVSADAGCVYLAGPHAVECTVDGLAPEAGKTWTIDVHFDDRAIAPPPAAFVSALRNASTPAVLLFSSETTAESAVSDEVVAPRGLAREDAGRLLVADAGLPQVFDPHPVTVADGRILRLEDGTTSPVSAGGLLVNPTGIVVDPIGPIYVADTHGIRDDGTGNPDPADTRGRILSIDPGTGAQTIVSELGLLDRPRGLAWIPPAHGGPRLLVTDASNGRLVDVDVGTGAQAEITVLVAPRAVVFESSGHAVVADGTSGLVRVDLATGIQSVVRPISSPDLVDPLDLALDVDGSIWVADGAAGSQGGLARFESGGALLQAYPSPVHGGHAGIEVLRGLVNPVEALGTSTPDPDLDDNERAVLTELETLEPPTVQIAVLESVGIADGPVLAPALFVTLTETVLVTDAPHLQSALQVDVAETIQVSDVPSAAPAVLVDVVESVGIADAPGLRPAVFVGIAEAIEVSDVTAATPAMLLTVHEPVTVTDEAGISPVLVVAISEPITVADAPGLLPALVLDPVLETVAVGDLPSVGAVLSIEVAESVGVHESTSLDPALMLAISEPILLADDPRALVALVLPTIIEAVSLSDSGEVEPAVRVSLSESIAVTDGPSLLAALLLPTVAEAIAVSDGSVLHPALVLATVLESVAVADAPTELQIGVVDPPRVVELRTVAATDDDRLEPGETTEVAITQVYVVFDRAMSDPPGDDDADDVTNPENYLLVGPGTDGVFQTVDCATGVDPGDVVVPTGPVVFLTDTATAAVVVDAGSPLAAGRYRLHACGTSTLVDEDGTPLDGDADGEPGGDFVLDFGIATTDLLADPNFDRFDDGNAWTAGMPAGAVVEPSAVDAGEAPTSASVRLDSRGAAGELTLGQCVAMDGGAPHRVGAELRQVSSSADWPISWLRVEVFSGADCTGAGLADVLLPLTAGDAPTWRAFEEDFATPAGAVSARITLGSTSVEGEAFEAFWDDTFVSWDPSIFGDGFESGNTTRWR